jgi:hypothetical protein
MIRAAYAAWQAKTVTELTPLAKVVEAFSRAARFTNRLREQGQPSFHSPHLSLPDVAKPLPGV